MNYIIITHTVIRDHRHLIKKNLKNGYGKKIVHTAYAPQYFPLLT